MNKPILNQHIEFLKELEGALDEALVSYSDAPESEVEELRHMRREVDFALRSAEKLLACEYRPESQPQRATG